MTPRPRAIVRVSRADGPHQDSWATAYALPTDRYGNGSLRPLFVTPRFHRGSGEIARGLATTWCRDHGYTVVREPDDNESDDLAREEYEVRNNLEAGE